VNCLSERASDTIRNPRSSCARAVTWQATSMTSSPPMWLV
jgi:hypothetical protein